MAGEGELAVALGKIAADADGERGFLREPRDMLVSQALGADTAILAREGAKQRAIDDPAEPHPNRKAPLSASISLMTERHPHGASWPGSNRRRAMTRKTAR